MLLEAEVFFLWKHLALFACSAWKHLKETVHSSVPSMCWGNEPQTAIVEFYTPLGRFCIFNFLLMFVSKTSCKFVMSELGLQVLCLIKSFNEGEIWNLKDFEKKTEWMKSAARSRIQVVFLKGEGATAFSATRFNVTSLVQSAATNPSVPSGVGSSAASGEPSRGTESERGWRGTRARKMTRDATRRLRLWRTLYCRNTHTHTLPAFLGHASLSYSTLPFHGVVSPSYAQDRLSLCSSVRLHTESDLTRPKRFSAGTTWMYLYVHLNVYLCLIMSLFLRIFYWN